jgi:hypothetical protein
LFYVLCYVMRYVFLCLFGFFCIVHHVFQCMFNCVVVLCVFSSRSSVYCHIFLNIHKVLC